jgi:hypothetical protein
MNTETDTALPTTMSPTLSLREASYQEIQLELIRRRKFNAFDGERVVATLLEHRDLWEAVMMERLAVSNPGRLPVLGMVKLRDLPADEWNVDTLYILTRNTDDAERLAEIIRMEKWGGLVDVHSDPDDVDCALGGAEVGQAVVAVWWE